MRSSARTEPRHLTPMPWERLAWLPVPVTVAVVAGLWVADWNVAWPCPPLFWLLAYGPTALAVGFIALPAARHFLANGQGSVLMLGCGMWVLSLGVVGGALGAARSLDTNWAIYSSAVLLSALCHSTGVAGSARRRWEPPIAWLMATYLGGLAVVGLTAWGAYAGWMPAFHRPGLGGTWVHAGVMTAAVALFGMTAGLLWRTRRYDPSPFLTWYALGLALIAAGLAGSLLITAADSPLQWTTRCARALGTVYLCVAVLVERRALWARRAPLAEVARTWAGAWLAGLRRPALLGWGGRYGLAVLAVAAAFALRLAITAGFGPGLALYLTFYPAVMVAATLAGFGPGLLATILAGACVMQWLLKPVGPLAAVSVLDRIGLVLFFGMGLFMSAIAALYRGAQAKAEAYDREAARRESEAKYLNLFNNMTEEVHFWKLVRDGDGGIRTWSLVDANPPALATWGRTRDEILGRTTDEIFGPGATEHFRPVVEKIMAEGVPHAYEDYFPHLGRHFRFTSIPMGEYFITTGADITGLKRIQEGLVQEIADRKRLEAALVEEARRKDDFLALLGHELRNPLAPIGYAVHLLRRGGENRDLAERACAIVERQVSHMGRLVDDLLNISRISLGKIQLKPEDLDLEETLKGIVADYRPLAGEHGLELDVRGWPEPIRIRADPARIIQTVSNLLNNAIKFTDPGGRIEIRVGLEPGWATVRVKDTGLGIPPDQLGSIFEPFMQGKDSIGRSRGGLGLGLALVKGLVALHGGRVSVASDGPGKGSEFTLVLPALPAASGPPAAPVAAGARAGRSRRILVVEDLLDSALTLKLLLELAGHTVITAGDGQTALDQAASFRPEIILCDIGLPGGLSGLDVARAIRATPGLRDIHLIALSGFGTPEDKEEALRAGFEAHLTKPVDPAGLGPMLAGMEPVRAPG